MPPRHLHKFGGSSLADADRYRRVAHILLTQGEPDDLVVVSAAGKTTNALIALLAEARDGRDPGESLTQLQAFQRGLIDQLLEGNEALSLVAELNADITRLNAWLAEPVRYSADVQALGELWSSRLLAALLRQLGASAANLDARRFLTLAPDLVPSHNGVGADLDQWIAAHPNTRLVITGYIGVDESGETVLLGRNGTDYSATLIASLAGIPEVTIWTDVEGVFNADPNLLNDARLLPAISLDEADRLAQLGSPVLHPRTLQPLKATAMDLNVRSSFTPDRPFTRVYGSGDAASEPVVTSLSRVTVFHCDGSEEELNQALATLAQFGISPLLADIERRALALLPEQAEQVAVVLSDSALADVRRDDSLGLVALVTRDAARLRGAFCRLLPRQAWPVREDAHALATLLPTGQVADLTARAHRRCAGPRKRIGIVVAGKGNIGSTWLAQFAEYQASLQEELEADLSVVALLGSRQALVEPEGLCPQNWQRRFDVDAEPYELVPLIESLTVLSHDELVLLDFTACAELGRAYPQLLERGVHLVSANKQAGSGPLAQYQRLKQYLAEHHLYWRYNATVGAGLPVFYSVDDLRRSGDQIEQIGGVFSGTLSWLFHHYDGQKPFSELVLAARAEGLTEPDPRDDLSGVDMQRKLLILARELGLELELDQVELESLVPEALRELPLDEFLQRADELDRPMAEAVADAAGRDKVLRYTAALALEPGKLIARVGLEEVEPDHPFVSLPAGDNQFLLRSRYYPQGLVIQGPGAGRAVTAAAVQSDLVAICRRLLH